MNNTEPNRENEENYVRKRLVNCILYKLSSEWVGHIAYMRWKRNAYKILVRKTEEKKLEDLGRDQLIIKIDLTCKVRQCVVDSLIQNMAMCTRFIWLSN